MTKKISLIILSHLFIFYLGYDAYRYGLENDNKIFPITKFIERNLFDYDLKSPKPNQKRFHVYSNISKKEEISCPKPKDSYVIVGFGQSNSANSAGHRFHTDKRIVNFFNGKCYAANDPMLGASGIGGSVWIPLTEELNIEGKLIVLATLGIGGTKVSEWLDGEYLLPFYRENIDSLNRFYENPNAVVWIQGESDVLTEIEVLNKQLKKWFRILRKDFEKSNIYITGTSYCFANSNENILKIQKSNAKEIDAIYVGSTDELIDQSLRYDDCHFSEKGIRALASLIAKSWIK